MCFCSDNNSRLFCISDIPVELQNPHVIKEHQICVGIVKSGPDGVALNSSYNNRYIAIDHPDASSFGHSNEPLYCTIPNSTIPRAIL